MQYSKGGRYEKIGPTAWGVAYERSLSDIKYAKGIFDELNNVVKSINPIQIEYMESVKKSKLAPQFEARYKLINHLIEKNKINQILEIASGLSPRGLEMTDENQSLQYVEVDLPVMAGYKREMLQNLFAQHKAKARNNLHIEDGNALDQNSLLAATQYFKNEPTTIVSEGLLRYLNFNQKAVVARNVQSLLEKFGGSWITPDVTLKKILAYEDERIDNRRRILALSGIDVGANSFESEEEARKFFVDLGFSVERHSFLEVIDELVSPKKLGLSPKEVEDSLRYAVVFVMKLN